MKFLAIFIFCLLHSLISFASDSFKAFKYIECPIIKTLVLKSDKTFWLDSKNETDDSVTNVYGQYTLDTDTLFLSIKKSNYSSEHYIDTFYQMKFYVLNDTTLVEIQNSNIGWIKNKSTSLLTYIRDPLEEKLLQIDYYVDWVDANEKKFTTEAVEVSSRYGLVGKFELDSILYLIKDSTAREVVRIIDPIGNYPIHYKKARVIAIKYYKNNQLVLLLLSAHSPKKSKWEFSDFYYYFKDNEIIYSNAPSVSDSETELLFELDDYQIDIHTFSE